MGETIYKKQIGALSHGVKGTGRSPVENIFENGEVSGARTGPSGHGAPELQVNSLDASALGNADANSLREFLFPKHQSANQRLARLRGFPGLILYPFLGQDTILERVFYFLHL